MGMVLIGQNFSGRAVGDEGQAHLLSMRESSRVGVVGYQGSRAGRIPTQTLSPLEVAGDRVGA